MENGYSKIYCAIFQVLSYLAVCENYSFTVRTKIETKSIEDYRLKLLCEYCFLHIVLCNQNMFHQYPILCYLEFIRKQLSQV